MSVFRESFGPVKFWHHRAKRCGALVLSGVTLGLSLLTAPALAGDPFRPSAPNPTVDDQTEAAFELIFEAGNYVEARSVLEGAIAQGSDDPLTYAMMGSIAFLDQDWAKVDEYGQATQDTAAALVAEDELRGNLYQAVGVFFKGAAMLKERGVARGTPQALSMLQQVFGYIEAAEAVDPNDPELSLIKGFMDLMLAVNLPFANPEQAITQLENTAYPVYVAQRGVALGYRDLDELNNAVVAVDQAIAAAPENPELLALKGQIHAKLGDRDTSLIFYNQALESKDILHPRLASQIHFEQCRVERTLSRDECYELTGLRNYQ
ncbi:MAG: Sll0314/Alr1548 family TPR repeat-containing protein [Cyanobacteria bacterium J06648_16]